MELGTSWGRLWDPGCSRLLVLEQCLLNILNTYQAPSVGHVGFRAGARSQQDPGVPSLPPWGSQLAGVRMRVADE